MRRRTLSIREARAEVEAAEARGLPVDPRPTRRPAEPPPRETPKNQPRLRVVWTVRDVGGRTVATFPYPEKAQAEAHAADLEARGRGTFFVRSEKQTMAV